MSKLLGSIIVAESADRTHAALLLEIVIDCPECGVQQIRIAGHHLRAIRNLCIEAIDQFPQLCGEEAGLAILRREQTMMTNPGGDPDQN